MWGLSNDDTNMSWALTNSLSPGNWAADFILLVCARARVCVMVSVVLNASIIVTIHRHTILIVLKTGYIH